MQRASLVANRKGFVSLEPFSVFVSKDQHFLWTSACFVFLFCNDVFSHKNTLLRFCLVGRAAKDCPAVPGGSRESQVLGYVAGTSSAPRRVWKLQ